MPLDGICKSEGRQRGSKAPGKHDTDVVAKSHLE